MSTINDLIERLKELPELELKMHIRMRVAMSNGYDEDNPPHNNVHGHVAMALMLELDRRRCTPLPFPSMRSRRIEAK